MSQRKISLLTTYGCLTLVLLCSGVLQACKSNESIVRDFSPAEVAAANTAANESYLSPIEKEVFYYLNLVRMNPKVFARTYVKDYLGAPGYTKGYAFDERKISLMRRLTTMQPLPIIKPSRKLFDLAECFAIAQGKKGEIGHDRSATNCNVGYHAECCSYGNYTSGLYYVLELLVDSGEHNAALGHRNILLGDFLFMALRNAITQDTEKALCLTFGEPKTENRTTHILCYRCHMPY